MTRRLGVLGGTFDPIHCGHLDAGTAADAALGLTELIVVPSYIPPHRPQPLASGYHRFAMVALAAAGRAHWRASDLELLETTPSYTATTLARLHAAGYPPLDLFFIVGADAFAEIASWRQYPALLEGAHFAVVTRPGSPVGELPARLPAIADRMRPVSPAALASEHPLIFLIDAPTADVSSTAIRQRCARGESIAGMVSPAVAQHIEQHGLYSNTTPAGELRAELHHPAAGRMHGED